MLKRYSEWLIKGRWIAILISLFSVAVLTWGAQYLSFTIDYRAYFGKSNPQLTAFQDLQDTYEKNDNVLIMLEPGSGEVFSEDTLLAVKELTDLAWKIPFASRVNSLTNFQHSYADEDDIIIVDLIEDPASLDAEAMRSLKSIALSQPLLVDRLLSPEAHVTGVNINFQLPLVNPEAASLEIIEHIDATLAKLKESHPGIKTYKTGVIAMNTAFLEAAIEDMTTLIPTAFTIILLGFLLFTKSISGTLASLLVILMSIGAAMGTAGWMGIVLTTPSSSAPTLILTLAVADCVHYLVTYFQQMRGSSSKTEAIKESVRLNFSPIFLTSVTTAIGFLTMNFSDSPPFHDLGNITALGVLYAFLLSVFFLPALMAVLPMRKPIKLDSNQFNTMEILSNFVIKHQRPLLLAVGALIVALIAMIPRIELNDNFVNYFEESIPFRADTDHIDQELAGMYFAEFSLDSKKSSGINEPSYLKQLALFEEWLEQQPEVMHVTTLAEIYRRMNKNMHADDESFYKIPDEKPLAAQYLLMYEMSLPYGLNLNNQVNLDKSSSRVTASLYTLSTKEVIKFENRVEAWMKIHTPELATKGSGASIMFAHISKRNIIGMLSGTTLALILISFILMVSLKSIKLGLISLIPNLVPAAMAFGVWAIFVGQVGLAVSVVVAMTLGIVVDDTIHFTSKYLRARREEGKSAENAVRYAFNTVGVALLITTVILTAGFMIIAQSSFLINANMGLLTAITICIALFVDFLFLPPLLMLLDKK